VRRCRFERGTGGTTHEESDGIVEDCTIVQPSNFGILSLAGSTVRADRNFVYSSETSMRIRVSSSIQGSGNLLAGASYASVYLVTDSTCSLRANDIIPSGGFAVRTESYLAGAFVLDLSENYWGVETASEIAARIWDSNDDPGIHATVVFEPFEIESVPAEVQSFGELKASFRQND
jgi:hypothetical protein